MTRVKWDELDSKTYEDMVSALLSQQHPSSVRLDGSGGDGGRDVYFPDGECHHAFELKSFTGRLSVGGRKNQIKKSLQRAKKLTKLCSWTLVAPIDLTPEEEEWFDELKKTADFPLEWRGKTWLDSQMAEHPALPRYFVEGRADEVLNLLREINQEQAALTDAPEAMERLAGLAKRANELDPYYRFELRSDGEHTGVTLHPLYPRAVDDSPITVNINFVFPKTPEGEAAAARFQEAMDFGVPLELSAEYVRDIKIDAPAGMGGSFDSAQLSMSPAHGSAPEEVKASLAVVSPEDKNLAQLPVTFVRESTGKRGAIFGFTDRTGTISGRMKMAFDPPNIDFTIRIDGMRDYYPNEMLPVARFLDVFHKPNRLLLLSDGGEPIGKSDGVPKDAWVPPYFARMVEDLDRIQSRSGIVRAVSPEITEADLAAAERGGKLARGESIEGTWDTMRTQMREDATEESLSALASGTENLQFVSQEPQVVVFQGTAYPLGSQSIADFDGAILSPADRERYGGSPPPGSEVILVPHGSNRVRVRIE